MSFNDEKRLKLLESQVVVETAATVALNTYAYGQRRVNLKRAGGQAITLPAATGTGGCYRLFVGTTVTSSTTIKTNGSDIMSGIATVQTSNFQTASNTNTITLNGTTTGGILGSYVELFDMGAGQWAVVVRANGSGTAATCFSNT